MLNYTKINKKNLRHYSRDHKYVPFCVFIQIYIQIFETPFQIFFFLIFESTTQFRVRRSSDHLNFVIFNVQNDRFFSGLTALHQAVLDNNLSVVKILISHGSEMNLQDEDSWTALHAACANGCWEIAK